MRFQQLSTCFLTSALLLVAAACVIQSEGEMFFSQGGEVAERRESLPLELAASEELRVELPFGDISVRVAEGEAPHVEAHWHANAEDSRPPRLCSPATGSNSCAAMERSRFDPSAIRWKSGPDC